MPSGTTIEIPIQKIQYADVITTPDSLAVEEPLEIKLMFSANGSIETKTISITMRTPGEDEALATGFLFTEGIIQSKNDIEDLCATAPNSILIRLKREVSPNIGGLDRNCYTTSSCGVCGKTSLDAIKTVGIYNDVANILQYPVSLICSLPGKLQEQQKVFRQTGGLHASALFDANGTILLLAEDVGRHNALDKLIGSSLLKEMLPLNELILLLSGRISFELVQKAAMAGIRIIAAIGAPSSLAVQTAIEFDITLVGFLNANRMNIYSGNKRILL